MTGVSVEQTACVICRREQGEILAAGRDYVYATSEDRFTFVRCRNCQHVYLNPRPRIEEVGRIYPPTYASFSGLFAGGGWLESIKDRVSVGRIRGLLRDLPPGARVLDVGCGDGRLLSALRRSFPALRLTGLDWKFAPAVRESLSAQGIEMVEAILEKADLGEAGYDLVILNQLVEHLWDPEAALTKLARSLAPGGWMAVATPDIDGYDRVLFRHGTWGGYYFPRHLNLFSATHLAALVSRAGLSVVSQRRLLAPVVWTYSMKAVAVERFPSWTVLRRFISVGNLPLLILFAAVDALAVALGRVTSNQLLLARRPDGPGR